MPLQQRIRWVNLGELKCFSARCSSHIHIGWLDCNTNQMEDFLRRVVDEVGWEWVLNADASDSDVQVLALYCKRCTSRRRRKSKKLQARPV